ncbi:MAG: hypothetical protein Q9175_001774 [Cornicularia normoerica]
MGKVISEFHSLANSEKEKNVLEPFYLTSAASMYHETWHMRYTIANSMIEDYNPGYWSPGSWDLAATKGAYWTLLKVQYPGGLSTLEDLFKLATAPLPKEVYEQQAGFIFVYSGITFTYDDSDVTIEFLSAGFVDPTGLNIRTPHLIRTLGSHLK